MKILVDENIPRITVMSLANLGHDVRDIRGTPAQGASDEELWKIAQSEQRLLITTDKGFSARRNSEHAGMLIVRLSQPNKKRIHDRVLKALAGSDEDEWPDQILIVRDRIQSRWRGPQNV